MKYYSEFGQDFWLYNEDCFVDQNGFFVDIGASHRKSGYMSNTLFFEKHFNWSGILIEPNEKISQPLRERNSTLLNIAVSNKNGFINFQRGATGATSKVVNKEAEKVACKTITTILKENNAPKTIDLISIDIEGHEMEAIEGIDFEKYKFKNIIIEENGKMEEVKNTICGYGYIFVEHFQADLYFTLNQPTNKPSALLKQWNDLPNKAELSPY